MHKKKEIENERRKVILGIGGAVFLTSPFLWAAPWKKKYLKCLKREKKLQKRIRVSERKRRRILFEARRKDRKLNIQLKRAERRLAICKRRRRRLLAIQKETNEKLKDQEQKNLLLSIGLIPLIPLVAVGGFFLNRFLMKRSQQKALKSAEMITSNLDFQIVDKDKSLNQQVSDESSSKEVKKF